MRLIESKILIHMYVWIVPYFDGSQKCFLIHKQTSLDPVSSYMKFWNSDVGLLLINALWYVFERTGTDYCWYFDNVIQSRVGGRVGYNMPPFKCSCDIAFTERDSFVSKERVWKCILNKGVKGEEHTKLCTTVIQYLSAGNIGLKIP